VTRKTPSLRIALPVAIAALVFALAPTALAGKGGGGHAGSGGGGGGSITLSLLNSTDGLAHYGKQVTFNVSASFQPWVNLTCYQNGTLAYNAWAGFFPSYEYGQIFTLTSGWWTGGAADCTANLTESTAKGLVTRATTTFHVYA
jgi:hypothetical protein